MSWIKLNVIAIYYSKILEKYLIKPVRHIAFLVDGLNNYDSVA